MRRAIFLFPALLLLIVPPTPAPAQPSGMKATAPMKMTPPGDGKKMLSCDDKAVQQNIPMEQRADFVKKCMKEMK